MLRSILLMSGFFFASLNTESGDLKTDLELIQGGWVGTKLEVNGKIAPLEVASRGKYVFKDNTVTIFEEDKIVGKATFTIDQTKTPRTIDLKAIEETAKSRTMQGIYRIEGDKLILCFGVRRPTEFNGSEKGMGLMEFKREK